MKKIILCTYIVVFTLFASQINSNPIHAQKWLEEQITNILDFYRDENISSEVRLSAIEESINENFAGTGIARFVVKNVWNDSSKEDQERFIKLFKEHLYITIGSLMRGYSNQTVEFINSKEDKNQSVYLIDMEIDNNNQKTLVTWRVKEFKEKYYVIDLLVADISLIITKRDEFTSMLKKTNNSLAELNNILKEQNIESLGKLLD